VGIVRRETGSAAAAGKAKNIGSTIPGDIPKQQHKDTCLMHPEYLPALVDARPRVDGGVPGITRDPARVVRQSGLAETKGNDT
jgi:hypothetical protein